MLSFTREEYDRKLLGGELVPQQFIIVEADGRNRNAILTTDLRASTENPRLKDPQVQQALIWLVDLLEYYLEEEPVDNPFSDMLKCEDAYSLNHSTEMQDMIKKGLVRLKNWLAQCTQGDHADLVDMSKKCVTVLRTIEF
jgi:hypothetical protein